VDKVLHECVFAKTLDNITAVLITFENFERSVEHNHVRNLERLWMNPVEMDMPDESHLLRREEMSLEKIRQMTKFNTINGSSPIRDTHQAQLVRN
jgi:hypothetical protein